MINYYLLIPLLFLFSCESKKNDSQAENKEWGYRGECSPKKWHKLSTNYGLCQKGHKQSPINIGTDTLAISHTLEVNYKKSHEYLINNGHTVEMLYDNGSSITFDYKIYDLVQFHFHTPSEHHLKDTTFPAEMHFVHRSPEGEHLVIGLLLKSGKFNKVIQTVIEKAPNEVGENEAMEQINIGDIYPEDSHFYFYEGSFTTPPCTENVKWLIHRKHAEASASQLSKLFIKEGINARPIQKIYERQVEVF